MNSDDLDIKFIDLFLQSVETTFNKVFNCEVTRGEYSVGHNQLPEHDVAIITGVIGQHHTGIIVYSMRVQAVHRLIGFLDPDFNGNHNQLALFEGLGEVINIISGNTMTYFAQNDIMLDITTPSVVVGNAFKLYFLNQITFSNDILSPFGMMEVNIAIKKC
ncbi:chemotaxis protein CheX [bacterium]|nr:chemotaxis protein CheX [bacterium]